MSEQSVLKIECPKCKVQFNYYDSEFRPFCSNKCQMIDLGRWLDEGYNIDQDKLGKID